MSRQTFHNVTITIKHNNNDNNNNKHNNNAVDVDKKDDVDDGVHLLCRRRKDRTEDG